MIADILLNSKHEHEACIYYRLGGHIFSNTNISGPPLIVDGKTFVSVCHYIAYAKLLDAFKRAPSYYSNEDARQDHIKRLLSAKTHRQIGSAMRSTCMHLHVINKTVRERSQYESRFTAEYMKCMQLKVM